MNSEFTTGTPWVFSHIENEEAVFTRLGADGGEQTLWCPVNAFDPFATESQWTELIYEENLTMPTNFL